MLHHYGLALGECAKITGPDILEFHKEVINSVERFGRTHKLEIMLRYKLRMHQWFQDMDIGLKMLAKRKLDHHYGMCHVPAQSRDSLQPGYKGADPASLRDPSSCPWC
jgi:hypothetical protein